MGRPRGAPDRRRSVVYLRRRPQGAFEDVERPRAVLDQRNEAFVPYVLAITVGTTVDFPNSDRTYHNVFSLSKRQALRPRPLRARRVQVRALRRARGWCASSATSTPT